MGYGVSNFLAINEIGKRENNEDCIFPTQELFKRDDRLFIVSDGVGGSNKGEIASEIVCKSISKYADLHFSKKGRLNKEDIQSAIKFTRDNMADFIRKDPQAEGMAATLVMAFLGKKEVTLAWCGDSRVYYFRKGKLIYKSKDHSLVNYLLSIGEITEDQARNHPHKNSIINCITVVGNVSNADLARVDNIKDNDIIILCTDGIFESVSDEKLGDIVRGYVLNKEDPKKAIEKICEVNSRDNYSMIFLELIL
jgi:serine/threonine protein phosphatase PrpC